MRTHKILYRHNGEVSYTPKSPHQVWQGQVDLEQTTEALFSSDDWRKTTVKLWEVVEVTLPDWLEPGEWIRNCTQWKWLWGFGVDPTWPEQWQRKLNDFRGAKLLAFVKLLKTKNFRSEFRRSMRQQLEDWLNDPEPEYNSPFSRRQLDCLIKSYDRIQAQRLDSSLYLNRSFRGVTV